MFVAFLPNCLGLFFLVSVWSNVDAHRLLCLLRTVLCNRFLMVPVWLTTSSMSSRVASIDRNTGFPSGSSSHWVKYTAVLGSSNCPPGGYRRLSHCHAAYCTVHFISSMVGSESNTTVNCESSTKAETPGWTTHRPPSGDFIGFLGTDRL